jgi:hypothetical protein
MTALESLDMDAVVAVADLVARAGGREFEIGHLEDGVPVEQARWYATARFKGAMLIADEKAGPDEAADALARRILSGGKCTYCHKTVVLNLTKPNKQCLWHRDGNAWVQGCNGKRSATLRAK